MIFSIIGGEGFIGRHLVSSLRHAGSEVRICSRGRTPERADVLGHVIYAAGVTGDFRQRVDDLLESNVVELRRILAQCRFDSLLYLSSTRLYGAGEPGVVVREDQPIAVMPSRDSLYDLSKLLGEALCLSDPRHCVRVARLSNVYGVGQRSTTFLGSLLQDLATQSEVPVQEDERSSKDYISVHDVVELLPRITIGGQCRIYNVASGVPLTHGALARLISQHTGRRLLFASDAPIRASPAIDISRIQLEFGFDPMSIAQDIDSVLVQSGVPPQGVSETRNIQ